MWFLYMKEDTGYEEFLVAAYEAKTEGSKGKIVSTKAKALTVEKVSENSNHIELKDLKQQIESLPAIMKGTTVGNIKPKMGGGAPSQRKKEVSSYSPQKPPPGSPRRSKRPGTNAAGPFRPGQKLIKCYCCDGWGHGWQECPTLENLNWRELIRAAVPTSPTNPVSNPTPNHKSKSMIHRALRQSDLCHNPDPLF